MKKILPIIAAFLIGSLTGVYFTRYMQKEAMIFSAGWSSQVATWACERGTASEARQAIYDYLRVMERTLASKPEPFVERIIRADMAIALTRLALIEEAEGHNEAAKQHQQRAADLALMTEYKSASPESIRAFVMRDTNFVFLLTKARQQQ